MPAQDSNPPAFPAAKRRPPLWAMIVLCALIAGLVGILHIASGSASAELGSHPDEAAHYVTGLMVRDYLASGFHGSPLRYAAEYYKHYPKIGLGNWPPLFYLIQAAWTLPFPSTVASVLWLMELLGVAVAMLTAWWLWREFGWAEAVAGAVLLTALPLVQQYTNMVMAEMLGTLLMFGAAGIFACYMERAEWRFAAAFGICAGLAILTKGTGLALVFVPPFAIVLTSRYGLLKRPALWGSALLAAAIGGPWTWYFRNTGRGGWEEASPSVHFTRMAVGYYGWQMGVALGGLLALLALAGAVSLFLPGARKPAIVACSLALVLGVWIFQSLTPVGLEARHLMPAMPALIVLAFAGFDAIASRCRAGARPAVAAGLLAVFFAWPFLFHPPAPVPGYGSLGNHMALSPFRVPRKEWGGFKEIADTVLDGDPSKRVLVASDARGEGMLIAEVASRDPHRPSFTIERASKLLASSTWSGSGYQSFYDTTDQVRSALAKAGIALVVTDSSPDKLLPHDKLLLELGSGPGAYELLRQSAAVRDGKASDGAVELWQTPGGP